MQVAGSAATGNVRPVRTADTVADRGGRGRPRDPSVEERVIEASRQELAERGFEEYSVRSVARRSGVSRPSLALRWPERDALIIETLERTSQWPEPDPSTGLQDRLEALVARMVELMDPTTLGIQLRLIADAPRHPKLFEAFRDKVMDKASAQMTALLRKAVDDGDLPADIDLVLAADSLIGAIFIRTLRSAGQRPISQKTQRRIVASMLEMWATSQPGVRTE